MHLAGATERRIWLDTPPRAVWVVLLAIVALGTLAAMVARVGPLPVLGLMLALTATVVMLIRPDTATLVTAFLLYTNVPAILTKEHGMPAVLAGAFLFLLAVPIAHAFVVRREPLRFDTTFGLMFAFLAVLLLSTLGAVDGRIALGKVQGYAIEGLLLYWLIVNAVRDVGALRKLFWAVLVAASLLSVLSLYQDLTGSYHQEFGGLAHRRYDPTQDPTQQEAAQRRQSRAQGPVDEPNRFAQILIVLVPIAGFMYRTARLPVLRLAAAGVGILTLTGVLLTLSRGGFVTLAVLAIAMASLRWIRPWHLGAGALALTVIVPVISPFFLDRLVSIIDARHLVGGGASGYQQADGAMRGRTTEMLAALYVFRDHPVVGVGPGQFAPFYFLDYAKSADIKFRDIAVPRRAHNLYLELASEYGALGLGVFVAIAGFLMRGLWRARRALLGHDAEGADLAAALWLSLFAYLLSGMFLHLSYERYYWLLLAMASATLHVLRARWVAGRGARREPSWAR